MKAVITMHGGTSHVELPPAQKEHMVKVLRQALSYQDLSNSYLNRKFGKKLYATEFSAFNALEMSFPTGLTARVRRAIEQSCPVELVGYKLPPASVADEGLRGYQNDAASALLMSHAGHVSIPTGGGKTHVIASLTQRLPTGKKVVVVPSTEILGQVHSLLEKKHRTHVSRLGGGRGDIHADGDLLVGTFQTICSRIDGSDEFLTRFLYNTNAIVVDECHHCPCDSIQKVMRYSKNLEYQYGLSATPWRADGLDMVMEGLVGPLLYEVPPKFLADNGFITRGTVFMLDVPKSSKLGGKKGDYSVIYRDFIVEYEQRRQLEVAACQQAMMMGLTTMCFVKHVRHGQDLMDKFAGVAGVALLTGEMPSKARRELLEKLAAGGLKLVIATVGKEGLDVPSIDAVILAGGGSDPSQEVGRALRAKAGKKMAYVWDFFDHQHAALAKQSRARLHWYEEAGIFEVKRS